MVDYDYNVYYSPDKTGLEIVDQIDLSDGCYNFNYIVIWRDKETGLLYEGQDSGCSCPSPFEDWTKEDVLRNPLDFNALEERVVGELREDSYSDLRSRPQEAYDFLQKVREAVESGR